MGEYWGQGMAITDEIIHAFLNYWGARALAAPKSTSMVLGLYVLYNMSMVIVIVISRFIERPQKRVAGTSLFTGAYPKKIDRQR